MKYVLALAALCGNVSVAAADVLDLPVPGRMLPPGTVISAHDLVEKPFEVNAVARASYATLQTQLIGRETLQLLPRGRPVALNSVRPVRSVLKGKPVKARFASGPIIITAPLVALEDGGEGSVIRLRNPLSGRVIAATVAAGGAIEVNP